MVSRARLGRQNLREAWHQQRVPGPHDFAVRINAARLARADRSRISSPCDTALRARHRRVHRIPRSTFVTIAIRPSLVEAGWRERNHRLLKNRSDLFFARGLDRNSRRLPVGQISWWKRERKRLQRSAFLFLPREPLRAVGRDRQHAHPPIFASSASEISKFA